MSHDLVLANLNCHAVLQNLEDLVTLDPVAAQMCRNWDLSIQFSVLGGPRTWVAFSKGVCAVGRGKMNKPSMKLFFSTPGHLNAMFQGKPLPPIIVKGFTRVYFLLSGFSKLTQRLEYFLKPTDELLQDPDYVKINTVLSMNTAAFAGAEIAVHDPVGRAVMKGICPGTVLLKILPEGPAVRMDFPENFPEKPVVVKKEDAAKPMACMLMKNMQVANAFLNQKMDVFSAIARGDVLIKGQTPMLDRLSLVLDRIPHYLA